jgi:hypothetical protein
LSGKGLFFYLRLNAQEEQTFQAEIDTMDIAQKDAIMQTTTSWEEKGMEKERRSLAKPLEENRPKSPTTRSLH